MNKFIANIITFSIIVLSVFYILNIVITTGLRKNDMIIYSNLAKLYNGKINADLIINGSSKAYVQVSPKIIDAVLSLNSYNLGLDGNFFILQKLQYELYEKYNKLPKIIIQIVSIETLKKAEGELYNYMRWAPYIDIGEVCNITKLYKGFSYIDYHLPFFRYSGYPIEIIEGILSSLNIHISASPLYKGYRSHDMPWDRSFDNFKKTNKNGIDISLDKVTCDLFEDYINNCKNNNIMVFLVYPPTYHKFKRYVKNREKLLAYYTKVSLKYNVQFLDFSQDELSKNKKYFYNSQHLNKKGSEIFTQKLAEEIKVRTHHLQEEINM
jgi:hypothetical protein